MLTPPLPGPLRSRRRRHPSRRHRRGARCWFTASTGSRGAPRSRPRASCGCPARRRATLSSGSVRYGQRRDQTTVSSNSWSCTKPWAAGSTPRTKSTACGCSRGWRRKCKSTRRTEATTLAGIPSSSSRLGESTNRRCGAKSAAASSRSPRTSWRTRPARPPATPRSQSATSLRRPSRRSRLLARRTLSSRSRGWCSAQRAATMAFCRAAGRAEREQQGRGRGIWQSLLRWRGGWRVQSAMPSWARSTGLAVLARAACGSRLRLRFTRPSWTLSERRTECGVMRLLLLTDDTGKNRVPTNN